MCVWLGKRSGDDVWDLAAGLGEISTAAFLLVNRDSTSSMNAINCFSHSRVGFSSICQWV